MDSKTYTKGEYIKVTKAGGRQSRLAIVTDQPYTIGGKWDAIPFAYIHRWNGRSAETISAVDHIAILGQEKVEKV